MVGRLFSNNFGEYLPGFFKIKLDIELHDNFNWEEFNENERATLVHEYIHYLQDISTTRGFSNFNFLAKIIQMYLNKVGLEKSAELIVPMDLELSGVENAYEQSELVEIYKGDDTHKKIHHVNEVLREVEECYQIQFNLDKDHNKEMYNINIYYDDKEEPYRFGGYCILESMAYLIEISMYPKEIRKNEFPYNSCELVCKKIYPELAENISCIIAMSDIALMHYHSGDFFYHLLLDMKENKYVSKNAEDVYKYTMPRIKHLYEDFSENFSETLDRINFLYPLDIEITKPINKWLRKTLETGLKIRCTYVDFISKIINFTNNNDSEMYLLTLMNIFGLPLVTDKLDGVYSGEINMVLMLVPIALIQLFTKESNFECYMYKYCKSNGEPQVCQLCLTSPWKQAEKEQLCPLALYWHHFSLEGKNLKRK